MKGVSLVAARQSDGGLIVTLQVHLEEGDEEYHAKLNALADQLYARVQIEPTVPPVDESGEPGFYNGVTDAKDRQH